MKKSPDKPDAIVTEAIDIKQGVRRNKRKESQKLWGSPLKILPMPRSKCQLYDLMIGTDAVQIGQPIRRSALRRRRITSFLCRRKARF